MSNTANCEEIKTTESTKPKEEHIYVNVNTNFIKSKSAFMDNASEKSITAIAAPKVKSEVDAPKETRKTPLIRESTGFDVVAATLKSANYYENSSVFQLEILDKKTSNLAETQSVLEHHRDSENFDANFDTELVELNNQIEKLLNKGSTDTADHLANQKLVANRETRTKSEGASDQKTELADESPTRRKTISSMPLDENACDQIANKTINNLEKPPVTLRSKSSASCIKPNSITKSVSNDEIQKRFTTDQTSAKAAQAKAGYKSKLEATKLSEEVDSTGTITPDTCAKRRKSENPSESGSTGQKLAKAAPEPVVLPKNRQSLSTNTTPLLETQTTLASLKGVNRKNMSKSLQDNSRVVTNIHLKKSTALNDQQNLVNVVDFHLAENEKLSVRTKIKLMESIANSKSSGNERSSSSSSSCSSSRSPPMSPKTIIEIVPFQVQVDKQKPPIVTARTNVSQTNATTAATLSNADMSSKHLENVQLKTSSNESLSEVSIKENLVYVSSESGNSNTDSLSSKAKEKRHTVKELMSKFEPK